MNTKLAPKISTFDKTRILDMALRFFVVLSLLYLFLVGVSVLGGSFKLMGDGFARSLLNVTSKPILALFSGMFATVLFQSSSVTTSVIVGLVTSETLPLSGAVPMIMGANLGTSVTNTLVSLGYIKNQKNFRDAFAAATVHDIFNILTIIILLPLELTTGFLEKSASALAKVMYGSPTMLTYDSPVKAIIKPVSQKINFIVTDIFGLIGNAGGIALAFIAAIIIIFSLSFIVRTMQVIIDSNKGQIIENLLSKNGYVAILFGTVLTVAVQSSSITTSLLVPMAGAGLLSLESILPVTIGANIGTTTTALLAALTGNIAALAIALVHFLFNLCGFLLLYIHPNMRRIPIKLCHKLANLTMRNRVNGVAYITVVFFLLPFSLTLIL